MGTRKISQKGIEHELREKYPDSRLCLELIDLYLLEKFVKDVYTPSVKPMAMVVGVSLTREASIIREFHEKNYGIKKDLTRIAACNKYNFAGVERIMRFDHYDSLHLGDVLGDATQLSAWIAPFFEFNQPFSGYDLTYIRNPDFASMMEWTKVFCQAVHSTKKKGVVITLIREEDVKAYNLLLNCLKNAHKIIPICSKKTNIQPRDNRFNFAHTMGVFSGKY